jgi:tetratricopeptide (TPR) repeat protein
MLKSRLDSLADVVLWTKAFNLGDVVIRSLCAELSGCDFAVLIATGDDLTLSRGMSSRAPRDNVLFEAGLFIGRLGLKRAYIVCDRSARVKIPTDLAGVTFAMFDSRPKRLRASLGRVGDQIGTALIQHGRADGDFVPSYLSLIHPTDKMLTHAELLRRNCDRLRQELEGLVEIGAWTKIMEVNIRVRELFEFAGLYREGSHFGGIFEHALRQRGETDEADWALVKNVAYLQILDGQHADARQILESVIASNPKEDITSKPARQQLLFYAHRYLGISYQRDQPPMLRKALMHFQRAEQMVVAFAGSPKDGQEMKARILGNLGNLKLELGQVSVALDLHTQSLRLFEDLQNKEHIGIENLHMAKAIVQKGGRGVSQALHHLHESELIAVRIGWLEGQGRVAEQWARYHMALSNVRQNEPARQKHLEEAERAAQRALATFELMKSQRWSGRIQALLDEIRRERRGRAAKRRNASGPQQGRLPPEFAKRQTIALRGISP